MTEPAITGRPNQKRRTRKALLEAAARLMRDGRRPSLDEIAEEALVSRATAYRYFPGLDTLLLEASLDVAVPEPGEIFRGEASGDPVRRLQHVDTMFHDMILAHEASLRMFLAHTLQQGLKGEGGANVPARQNRRSPLIRAALEPARSQFTPATFDRLSKALALIIGTEAMIVAKDVLQLADADTREVKRWAIRALVEAAKKNASETDPSGGPS